MSFLNKYTNGSYNYGNTNKYADWQSIGLYNYGIGYRLINNAWINFITKTDQNGDIVWEKLYPGIDNYRFHKIISCGVNDEIIVLGKSELEGIGSELKTVVLRLLSDGNVKWKRFYGKTTLQIEAAEIIKLDSDSYAILLTGAEKPLGANPFNLIIKINSAGDVLIIKNISRNIPQPSFSSLILKQILLVNNQIVLMGLVSQSNFTLAVIILDTNNLNYINKFGFNSGSATGTFVLNQNFYSLAFQDNKLILGMVGFSSNPSHVIAKLSIPTNTPTNGSFFAKKFNDVDGIGQNIATNSGSIYFSDDTARLFKLAPDLSIQWVKQFDTVYNSGFVCVKMATNNNTFIYTPGNIYLGMLDLDVNQTCIVAATTTGVTTDIELFYTDFEYNVTDFEINVSSSEQLVTDVTSTAVNSPVCPALIIPTFDQINPICLGKRIPPLPTISTNGITGTWFPAINNIVTTTYTFTPNPGQSALTATMTIIVNPVVTPTFAQVGPINSGDPLNPLPGTSNEGIDGNWSPAINNLETTTYTFTPKKGLCAVPTTMTIVVNNECVKDKKLCNLYNEIVKIVISCLPDPSKLDERHDFKPQTECISKILGYLVDFDKIYPDYDIIKLLTQEIYYIKLFIKNPNFTNYQNAWFAIQSILNYLSQLGNCNCENNLDITDYASIQSGHLYLQSVGSTGSDSTKGMHLRWALRGALFQHLPKANYATNQNNFNKPNDFVKIYRARYKPVKVVLKFIDKPIQVTETANQKNWLYEVDGKVFYIHFRNKIKYNQVRASFNPIDDPQTFIKNYGDALLEIENKTELSFKVTPKFEIIDTDSFVKLEVLSVLENKITAPKVASIRKKYATNQLNQNPLISENIRSVRFSSTNSFITSLEFELYSDFILNTKKANGWNYLGQYALTKETFEAYKRLEPQQHCIDKWLRYNDEAYVRVKNYQDKWNDSSLEPLERIVTSVEKYISLSDYPANVRAIEIFPFEDQSAVDACAIGNEDYDPLMVDQAQELDENTGVVVSYLDVLHMGSLDYHVARMIGLGTLDLNPVVFDGDFIYMSEYITFGDLQDGLGARQVQHFYCSLPTSLQDSRDCLAVNLLDPVPGVFYNTGVEGQEVDTEDDEDTPTEEVAPSIQLTNDGYSFDGKTKYFTFYTEPFDDELADAPFYYVDNEFESSKFTSPVFAGFEYKKEEDSHWVKPEVKYSDRYLNNDLSGVTIDKMNETVELLVPEAGKPLYTHAVKETCTLIFSSYGINWFSRATSSLVKKTETITITPEHNLLPPTNITATLIQKENPLFLTTAAEQTLYDQNSINPDKTLVRLTFEYDTAQELIDYHQKINGETIDNYYELPNSEEPFAESIQIFFRNQIPNSIAGKISLVQDNSNPLLLDIETSEYLYASTQETVAPTIPNGLAQNYVGSIMLVDGVEYVIHAVDSSSAYPKFTIFKSDASGALLDLNSIVDPSVELLKPDQGSFFMIVENMQNVQAWGAPNPSIFEVNLGHNQIHREDEIIVKSIDCTLETHVQKFRGVYENAVIEKIIEQVDIDDDPDTPGTISMHRGLYKITFTGFPFAQHTQIPSLSPNGNFVEWYNGIVRIHPLSDVGNVPRKNFKVVRTENIGTSNDLVLYIEDLSFPTDINEIAAYDGKIMSEDPSVNQITQKVNYYPGYKVYLYHDTSFGLIEANVLPEAEEEHRYTIFGLRSHDTKGTPTQTDDEYSKISAPTFMFAQAIREPLPPQLPLGGLYATRPDFFGKSSYTFTTEYGLPQQTQVHKPYSVQFNRASDIQFLSAIYDNTPYGYDLTTHQPILNTVQTVIKEIFKNGEEQFYVNRWNNLLGFNYNYDNTPPSTPPNVNGTFEFFDGVQLPLPNNPNFISSINAFVDAHNEFYNYTGTPNEVQHISIPNFNLHSVVIPAVVGQNDQLLVKDFMKDVLLNCFVPLTELPIIYDYVKGGDYKPIPKKQVVRDRNGNLLKPDINNPEFDMAPMMKRIDPPTPNTGNIPYKSQFTDFGLDGASTAKYFYAVREINNKLKTSDYSPILGPVSLVNTAPPIAPEIIKIIPVLENRALGIEPCIQLQINAYPKVHNIKKINIYRSDNPNDALFIRTMKLVKVIDIESEGLSEDSKWIFTDDFIDLPEVPFGDVLYYRMTVSREIKYNDKYYDPNPANNNDTPVIDYAPSEASKLVLTNVVENYSPESPKMGYASEPIDGAGVLNYVVLNWNKTVYKGNYHLYKMNAQGNWVEICQINSDRIVNGKYHVLSQNTNGQWIQNSEINATGTQLYLGLEATNLNESSLQTQTAEGSSIYHHFKVISENTAGMLSSVEHILTIYNGDSWNDNGGIAPNTGINGMIVQGTFIVRPD